MNDALGYILSALMRTLLMWLSIFSTACAHTYFLPRTRHYIEGRAFGFPLDKSPCRVFISRRGTTPQNNL